MEQELERLRNENHRLKEELTSLKEKETNQSFKEKYAVRILESLPDMLTVFNHEGTGIGVVSSEETNHVGVPNSAFAGMHMRDMIPEEAYHNVYNNLQKVIATGKGSTAHHELDVNGAHHYYENRIFPLDEEYVLIMCRDISERVVTQKNLEVFKRVLDKVSDSILAASTDGTLVYANKQFIEEYGVKGELGVQKVYDLPVSLHTKEIFEKRVQEIRDNGGSMGYHARYTRVGEVKERVHQVSTFIMEDGQEEIVWFFTQDITDVIKEIRRLAALEFSVDRIDEPKINVAVDYLDLRKDPAYQMFKELEHIELGDTVTIALNKLGLSAKARVIKLEYDCLKHELTGCEIGSFKRNYYRRVTQRSYKAMQGIHQLNRDSMTADNTLELIKAYTETEDDIE